MRRSRDQPTGWPVLSAGSAPGSGSLRHFVAGPDWRVSTQIFHRDFQVFGPLRRDGNGLAGDGMDKSQSLSMESGGAKERAFLLVPLEPIVIREAGEVEGLAVVKHVPRRWAGPSFGDGRESDGGGR